MKLCLVTLATIAAGLVISLPSARAADTMACMKDGQALEADGKNAQEKKISCIKMGGHWGKYVPRAAAPQAVQKPVEHQAEPAAAAPQSSGGGGGW
jgi:hypothetical protein